jgi:hypothetical protein
MSNPAWRHTPVIPALGRQRQEDHEFSLDSIARPCVKKKDGEEQCWGECGGIRAPHTVGDITGQHSHFGKQSGSSSKGSTK